MEAEAKKLEATPAPEEPFHHAKLSRKMRS
jgi:hypothetical protein